VSRAFHSLGVLSHLCARVSVQGKGEGDAGSALCQTITGESLLKQSMLIISICF